MNVKDICMILVVFLPFLAALISYVTGRISKKKRDIFVCCFTVLEFLMMAALWLLHDTGREMLLIPYICQMGISFEADGFRVVYGTIAAFMWMIATFFSPEYFAHYRNRNRYYVFWLITLGATEGVFLSGDLYTTFIFFEIMSFASYVWVAQDEKKASLRAAITYLSVAVIGGLVMLMGLFLLYHQTGTLAIDDLYEACRGKNVYVAAACLFFGFGAKAGAFPLHIWLPKAHPVAPAPSSALLSGILTKSGIFGVLVISCKILLHNSMWGTFVLTIGVLTMTVGALLAVFSIDFKRTLACSSVSQIGFILVGIGMQGLLGEENLLAVNGSFLHMMNHSLFKLVLFLTAGVIYMNLHRLDLNEIRGFGRKKPFLMLVYLSGALGIGGFPLFSGYVSKTLIHESIVEYMEYLKEGGMTAAVFGYTDMKIIEWCFLISGGLTVAYMCKLFVAVFLEKNTDEALQRRYDDMSQSYISRRSKAAIGFAALLFPLMGCMPHAFMEGIAQKTHDFFGYGGLTHHVAYFSFTNLKGGLTSIIIGVLVYFLVIRTCLMKKQGDGTSVYLNRWPKYLDLEDYLYRPLLLHVIPAVMNGVFAILDQLFNTAVKLLPISGFAEASFFDTLVDPVIIFMKENFYTGGIKPAEPEEGNTLTNTIGALCNRVRNLLNKTVLRKKPCHKDYVHLCALKYTGFKENISLIGRSLSYGLLLFSLGLLGTLIYLLTVLLRQM